MNKSSRKPPIIGGSSGSLPTYSRASEPSLASSSSLWSRLMTNKSLRTQVVVSYSLLSLAALGVTLALCSLLDWSFISFMSRTSRPPLLSDSKTRLRSLSTVCASLLDSRLTSLSASLVLPAATYAASALRDAAYDVTQPPPTYRDHHLSSCPSPDCPPDYQPLIRLANATASLLASSTYLFDGQTQSPLNSDPLWMSALQSHPVLAAVINTTALLDLDYHVLYAKGSPGIVSFSLTALITDTPPHYDYLVVHRAYPGTAYPNTRMPDPSLDPCFAKAPVNRTYFKGPYIDAISNSIVFSLSTKQTINVLSHTITFVSTAEVLVEDLARILHSIQLDHGYAAVINSATDEVLVWHNEILYNNSTICSSISSSSTCSRIPTLIDMDERLGALFPLSQGVFEYVDSRGEDWIVAVSSFFDSTTTDSRNVYSNTSAALTLLVFTKNSKSLSAVDLLVDDVKSTSSETPWNTISIVCAFTVVGICLTFLLLTYLTTPLKAMSVISQEVAREYAEKSEFNRNFSPIITKAERPGFLKRDDEIGLLYYDYYCVLKMLQNDHADKEKCPQYPVNPFHHGEDITWDNVRNHIQETLPTLPLGMKQKRPVVTTDNVFVREKNYTLPALNSYFFRNKTSYGALASDENSVKDVEEAMPDPTTAPVLKSVRFSLFILGLMPIFGILAAMVLNLNALEKRSGDWTKGVSDIIKEEQSKTIHIIGSVQALIFKTFYERLTLDVLVASSFVSSLLDHKLSRQDFTQHQQFYRASYSLDEANNFSSKNAYSLEYSGYFLKDDSKCELIRDKCRLTNESNQTKLTSLFDIKVKSFFYTNSSINEIALGMQPNGFIRIYPYRRNTIYARPYSCNIENTDSAYCKQTFFDSKCYLSADDSKKFPAYDSRCSNWYSQSSSMDSDLVGFSSISHLQDGKHEITGTSSIRDSSGHLLAVLCLTFNAIELVRQISSIRILSSGYAYAVDQTYPLHLLLHPKRSVTCNDIQCAEDFSSFEFRWFNNTVLTALLNGKLPLGFTTIYEKNGSKWLLVYDYIETSTFTYAIFTTVPTVELISGSVEVRERIRTIKIRMKVVFSIAFIIFLLVFGWLMDSLTHSILMPVYVMRKLLYRLKLRDNSVEAPKKSTSADMVDMIEAFSTLVMSIRLHDYSIEGDVTLNSLTLYSDAYFMFSRCKNTKGAGVSANNLSIAELKLGMYDEAENHMLQALRIAEKKVNDSAARRLLSDRRSNLAMVYLEKRKFPQALKIIRESLEDDRNDFYIKGCLVKQCNLGLYYLQQRDIDSAEKIIGAAFTVLRQALNGKQWDKDEAAGFEQLVLYISAYRLQIENISTFEDVQDSFLRALSSPKIMFPGITNRILNSLHSLWKVHGETEIADEVEDIIKHLEEKFYPFKLDSDFSACKDPSTIVLLINYSASMLGFKIKHAKYYIEHIYNRILHKHDAVGITVFNSIPEILKQIEVNSIESTSESSINGIAVPDFVSNLLHPENGCSVLDGIRASISDIYQYNSRKKTIESTIILLSDGCADDSSLATLQDTCDDLRRSRVKLIVIWLSDYSNEQIPNAGILPALVSASRKGRIIHGSTVRSAEVELKAAFSPSSSTMSEGILINENF